MAMKNLDNVPFPRIAMAMTCLLLFCTSRFLLESKAVVANKLSSYAEATSTNTNTTAHRGFPGGDDTSLEFSSGAVGFDDHHFVVGRATKNLKTDAKFPIKEQKKQEQEQEQQQQQPERSGTLVDEDVVRTITATTNNASSTAIMMPSSSGGEEMQIDGTAIGCKNMSSTKQFQEQERHDICLTGTMWSQKFGNDFDRIIALAKVWQRLDERVEALQQKLRRDINKDNSNEAAITGSIRLDEEDYEWYQYWFEDEYYEEEGSEVNDAKKDVNRRRIVQRFLGAQDEDTQHHEQHHVDDDCQQPHTTQYLGQCTEYISWDDKADGALYQTTHDDDEYDNDDAHASLRNLNEIYLLRLYSMIRQDHKRDAQQRLEAHYNNHDINNKSAVVIATVHLREAGGCLERIQSGYHFCTTNLRPSSLHAWGDACRREDDDYDTYFHNREEYVRRIIMPEGYHHREDKGKNYTNDDYNTRNKELIVIALGDTGEDVEAIPYATQIIMMSLSDYHFGNPQSSIDKVVSYWRRGAVTTKEGRNNDRRTFPEDCYETKPSKHYCDASPNDVCLTGTMWGRRFGSNMNRIITVAKVLQQIDEKGQRRGYEEDGHGAKNSTTKTRSGVILLDSLDYEWYRQWFEKAPDVVRPMVDDDEENPCTIRCNNDQVLQWDNAFFIYHDWNQTDEHKTMRNMKKRYMLKLFDMLRIDHKKNAWERLKGYGGGRPDSKVVTVHLRWLDGTCPWRSRNRFNFCRTNPDPPPLRWGEACNFTDEFVRQNLPSEYSSDTNSTIILLGDGQRPELEETFAIRDESSFETQLLMMTQSDYHFGNPHSSVDKLVSYWRGHKRTFPEDCFEDTKRNITAKRRRKLMQIRQP